MSTKKSLSLIAVAGVCVLTSGCNAIRNYSVRSYQGPMPLTEYQYMDRAQHGIPTPTPVATSTTTTLTAPAGQAQ